MIQFTNTLHTKQRANTRDSFTNYRIEQLDLKVASDELWDDFLSHHQRIHHENNPDDPLLSKSVMKAQNSSNDPYQQLFRWMIRLNSPSNDYIGYASVFIHDEKSPEFESNKHIARANISIAKEYRNRGLAIELLKIIIPKIKELKKEIIQTWVSHDTGKAFSEYIGGEVCYRGCENRLKFNEIDWNKMKNWIEKGKKRTNGTTIEVFNDVAEKDIIEYCNVFTETLNQAPVDDIEGEGVITPESRRFQEQVNKDSGYIWTSMITREKDGKISGLTEILYNPQNKHVVYQELTGVKMEYRGRGLGKWLKAKMLFYIKDNYPHINHIETGNAISNGPMLAINTGMGYKKYKCSEMYKFSTEELYRRLKHLICIE